MYNKNGVWDAESLRKEIKKLTQEMHKHAENLEFEEAHTALADTEIEAAILLACLKRHKKLHTNYIGQAFRHPIWRSRCKA